MAAAPEIKLAITADTSGVVRAARVIAKHMTALADELEAPDMIITFPGTLTPEQAAEFRERFKAEWPD